ncbi:Fungal lipase-like domain containing protein [Parasponia andersonii]|uniref:Fungal lipase-like domain containing protein n=1 Tax=Parasponia andersonii TaxID=3476 RepID=A0A2P5BRA8_PARAD|nr:Fungal lipase-like domain containing protein [Parasponia andersonii]
MACTSFSIPTSPRRGGTFKDHVSGLCRSESSKDLRNRATLRRCYSDNHLVCCIHNRIHATSTQAPKLKYSRSMGIFPFQFSGSILPNSLRSFLFDPETSKDMSVVDKETNVREEENSEEISSNSSSEGQGIKRANWVERLMELRGQWVKEGDGVCDDHDQEDVDHHDCGCDGEEGTGCWVSYSSDEEEEEEIGEKRLDQESFSRFLVRVSWSGTKLFSQLAFLCNIAYVIPDIRPKDLKRYFGLQFVTSSLEKKAEAAAVRARLDEDSTQVPVAASLEDNKSGTSDNGAVDSEQKRPIRASVAYEIAASAASYVQSKAKNMFSLTSESKPEDSSEGGQEQAGLDEGESSSSRVYKSEVAAFMAASTMTAVVAAGEKEKLEAAKDLQSLHSSPCEWFVCDDSSTCTRCFVIQGSDSLASWQANLFFEPTKFEETDCLVHRGIYEAAKGIYMQFMPEIIEHLNKYGERAKLQFAGHSLGGSLSLLVHLMLLTRKVAKPSALRPVVTFGSPFVFCGGQKILDKLGLDENQIHCVMMHRDIVPRAFSCNYPNHVANVLKRLNGSFKAHPCLIQNASTNTITY